MDIAIAGRFGAPRLFRDAAMTPETVTTWLQRIFAHEGGMSRDRRDHGNWTGGRPGAGILKGTKFGISAASYPEVDIESLTLAQAATIYERDFLSKLHIGRYPDSVGYQFFDYAVNAGIRGATLGVQRALGVKADGDIGPVTLAALSKLTPHDAVMLILAQRIRAYVRDPKWEIYSAGWMDRIAGNLEYAAADI